MTRQNRPLLSPEEAKQRLREIVEQFFSCSLTNEANSTVSRLLVRSPPGLGKTREALDWAAQYQTDRERGTGRFGPRRLMELDLHGGVAVFVPRHALAVEVKTVIERSLSELGRAVEVPILRGRDHDAENGRAPCRRWREARELGKKGLPVYSNLCQRRRGRETSECPHFQDCEYIRSWRGARDAPFVILVHAYLGLGWDSDSYEHFAERFDLDPQEDNEALFNPADVLSIVCDEDPTQSLVERTEFKKTALDTMGDEGLGQLIRTGLDAPAGLLSHLRAAGIPEYRLYVAAKGQRAAEQRKGRVADPSKPDGGLAAKPALVRLSRVLARLADELASGREGQSYSLMIAGEDRLVAQGRRHWPFDHRLLILDGTANPVILKALIPRLEVSEEIRVERNARVVQVTDRTFYRGSLLKSSPSYNEERWKEVCGFVERIARGSRTLVVTNRRVRCQLTGEDPVTALPISGKFESADIAHFGNLRGSNEFEEHDTVIILGRDEPNVEDAERRAMAIWYDTTEPIRRISSDYRGPLNYPRELRSYRTRNNSEPVAQVSVHPDPRVQAVVEQAREAEMLQAIDRLRLIHSTRRKTVYILCKIPLDLPVDELVTWKQLIGDERLSKAIAKCDERGWDALPLAAKALNGAFPELWDSAKAAERWLDKNPLERGEDVIRLWGVFEYRRNSQRRWSKALIRQGVEDPASALGKVLAISPENLRVRRSAEAQT